MPSKEHDILGRLFRQRPAFAAELLSGPLRMKLPDFDEVRVESTDFTDVKPASYAADAALALVVRGEPRVPSPRRSTRRGTDPPDPVVSGIVVEVQRGRDPGKRRSWPVYVATFSSVVGCPVILLVIATTESVARWAAAPIKFGEPDGVLQPVVLGPTDVPKITDVDVAVKNPELTVLSARVHGSGPDGAAVLTVLWDALAQVDPGNVRLYYELVLDGLDPKVRAELKESTTMTAVIPNDPRAVVLRRMMEGANARGRAEGEARLLLAVLAARGVDVPDEARERIQNCTDADQLEEWGRRAATATSVKELFE